MRNSFSDRVSAAASGADDNKSIAGVKNLTEWKTRAWGYSPSQFQDIYFIKYYCPGWSLHDCGLPVFPRYWAHTRNQTNPKDNQGLVGEPRNDLCFSAGLIGWREASPGYLGQAGVHCQSRTSPDPHASIPGAYRGCTLILETPEIKQATFAARNTSKGTKTF